MKKLFYSILSANRKHRSLAVGIVLRLLRIIRDIEDAEVSRYSDMLDKLNSHPGSVPLRHYHAAEDDYLDCEDSLEHLSSAIDDLGYAYGKRF